ncbi:related to aminoacyl-tRNA hydrolase [Phialocephala subalpina]|uniref:peptidyl-tRNA hydrolase n=1 Tax=Phialocephala subalpina TaxID=576137 RepID=A0A1L7XX24_9HELO|nr:related to aminoacyl-tRNA hydrolase [Phialocephala subalpina]
MSRPNETSQKLTRKQRRRQQQLQTPPDSDNDAYASNTIAETSCTITSSTPYQLSQPLDSAPMSGPIRLLVCSIGNPGQYLNTLHSAGHSVLNVLVSSLAYPPFQKSRAVGNGLLSQGSEFTFWQSTSLMNVSGPGVVKAWTQFQRESRGEATKLVVVHDELELGLGQVKVKMGSASAKGHNGLKSINGLLKGSDYTRIGVGIGRPESRDPDTVANYVLRKMSGVEKGKIEGSAGRVLEELRRLSEG